MLLSLIWSRANPLNIFSRQNRSFYIFVIHSLEAEDSRLNPLSIPLMTWSCDPKTTSRKEITLYQRNRLLSTPSFYILCIRGRLTINFQISVIKKCVFVQNLCWEKKSGEDWSVFIVLNDEKRLFWVTSTSNHVWIN